MKISVIAVGTRGDVEPHLALATGLSARGHEVKVAAPSDFASVSARMGLDFHAIGVSFRNLYRTEAGAALLACGNNPIRFIRELKRVVVPIARQVVADIGDACAGADLILYSVLGVPAYYFAREQGLPAVATCMQPMGRTRAFPSPLYPFNLALPGTLNFLTHVIAEQALWQFTRPLIRKTANVAVPIPWWGHFDRLYRERTPMLFAYSPALVPPPSDFQAGMHVTGFWRLPLDDSWEPPASLVRFLADGPPPVCVGFGSMNSPRIDRAMPVILRALRAAGKRAIVLTGWWDRDLPGESGETYFAESVPHAWLLPRVSAVIHHGGAGTVAAALRAGVPSVVAPFFFDQWFWAQSLYRQGLGPAPLSLRAMTERAVTRALADTENPVRYSRAIRVLSDRLKMEDGVGNAVAVIETLGAGRTMEAAVAL